MMSKFPLYDDTLPCHIYRLFLANAPRFAAVDEAKAAARTKRARAETERAEQRSEAER
jgi:hypothetical protein